MLIIPCFLSLTGKEKKNGWRTGKSTNLRQNRESVYQITLIAIISGSVIAILLLSCLVLALYRRKKIYGGFYIFKEPPSPDYFRNLDPSMALIEQTNKLPYDLAWEFPRKRIRLGMQGFIIIGFHYQSARPTCSMALFFLIGQIFSRWKIRHRALSPLSLLDR